MKLNRKWILVASLVLSVALATSGTLAYLTANDSETNTFTIGNVGIDLDEGNWVNNSTLLPGAVIAKEPSIKNTGNTDAWVWMEVKIPYGLWKLYEDGKLTIDWNTTDWTKTETEKEDGSAVVTLKRETKLGKEATTATAFTKVSLDKSVDNTDMAVFGSATTTDIVVNAYAIQADGIANVDKAYNAYNGITEPNGDNNEVTYPMPEDGTYTLVSNSEQLKTALNDKVATILLEDGEYNWSGTGHNGTEQTVSIYGKSKNAVLKVTNEGGEGGDNDFDGYTVTFTNLTITSDNNWSTGWKRMNATFNDCVINNNLNLVNKNHKFNYCTLNQTENEYNIWTYGASNAEFNYCTFNCAGKSIYVDGNRGGKTVLTVNNCIFKDNGGVEDKAAIETGTTYGDNYELIVNNTAVEGFAINPNGTSTNSTLWANKHNMTSDKLNVVVDGVDIF